MSGFASPGAYAKAGELTSVGLKAMGPTLDASSTLLARGMENLATPRTFNTQFGRVLIGESGGGTGAENVAHSAYQYELLKRDLWRQEIANPGETMSGPVVFRDPVAGATLAQQVQIREAVAYGNLAIDEGYMSPTGRVSTTGATRVAASRAADAERARALAAGDPYVDVVGHGPDTTWTNRPVSPFWQDMDHSINSSLGRQAQNYPLGYKPTRFIYEGNP